VAKQPSHPMKTSGPFRVQSASPTALLLAPNLYAQTRPHLSQYQLVLFSSFNDAASAFGRGDVDALLATTPAQRARLLRTHGAVAHDISTFRFVDVLFNEQVPGLDDAVVRRAIAAAVNRLQIVESALHGAGGREQVSGISQ